MQNSYDNVYTAGNIEEPNEESKPDTLENIVDNIKTVRQEVMYAGFWVRSAAYLIDSVIVFLGLLIVRGVFAGVTALAGAEWLSKSLLFQYSFKDIVLYICQVMYFILLTYYTGTTFGKRVMNLQVVRVGDLQPAGLFDIVYRETVGRFLSGLICCIGYLMIGIDKEKQALHDRLCDTRVIYSKKIRVIEYKTVQNIPASYRIIEYENHAYSMQAEPQENHEALKPQEEELSEKKSSEE